MVRPTLDGKTRGKFFQLKVSDELHAAVEELASEHDQSMTSWILNLITRELGWEALPKTKSTKNVTPKRATPKPKPKAKPAPKAPAKSRKKRR